MSLIHVERDGALLGHYTSKEVKDGLRTGVFRYEDAAWKPGRRGWSALGEWKEFAGAGAEAVPKSTASGKALQQATPKATRSDRRQAYPGDAPSRFVRTAADCAAWLTNPVQCAEQSGEMAEPASAGPRHLFWAVMFFEVPARAILRLAGISTARWNSGEDSGGILSRLIHLVADFPTLLVAGGLSILIQAVLLHISLTLWKAVPAKPETTLNLYCRLLAAVVPIHAAISLLAIIPGFAPIQSTLMIIPAGILLIHLPRVIAHESKSTIGKAIGGILTPIILCGGLWGS